MPPRNIHPFNRRENRIPMEIPVVLDGPSALARPGGDVYGKRQRQGSARGQRAALGKKGAPAGAGRRARENFVLKLGWPTANRCVATASRWGWSFLETKGRWVVESTN